jgi:hypothetical protein
LKQRLLTLLVSDWQDMTTFTPGLKGGQWYLIHKQSKTEVKEMTASTIKKLFSEIKCFLLPKHSAETDVAYKQQMSALLRLVLEQEPPIHTDEDDKTGQVIPTLLESLNALSTYTDIDEAELEWLAEPNVSYEDEENDIKETESDSNQRSRLSIECRISVFLRKTKRGTRRRLSPTRRHQLQHGRRHCRCTIS